MLDKINIVLSNTTHPGNIGAAARAMKVMGLSRLTLINPSQFPSAEASRRASRATDILADAKVCSSIEEAITDSRLIVGTSARTRSLPSKLVTPRQLVEKILNHRDNVPVAILFGTENSGLTNDELHLCHYHVCIPTNPDYSSLNLASAVQLIAYEMRLGLADVEMLPSQNIGDNEMMISREQMVGLLSHFDQVMQQTGYVIPEYKKQLDQRMNRLLSKAEVTQSELNILRGFLSSVGKYCERVAAGHSKE
ncbi:RNA methyltransferase [Aliikangiella coralliicola]|uniref:tRNA (cytidine/uridine-2'-O-)-methyltransferase TrmJ n=1 Tax=Aliikangiella coralliicola TaxID=2592383 RepID=A0A545UAG1_9GAMM|nr:RNA methyltransferase [Aliikangiella coralliicola]TQV86458.1 RNA methyltransferase [Aliikangiella coralliicola]